MKVEYQCSECFLVFAGSQGAADCHDMRVLTRDATPDLRDLCDPDDPAELEPDLVDILEAMKGDDPMDQAFEQRHFNRKPGAPVEPGNPRG